MKEYYRTKKTKKQLIQHSKTGQNYKNRSRALYITNNNVHTDHKLLSNNITTLNNL